MSAFNRRKIPPAKMDALLVDHAYLYQEICRIDNMLQKTNQFDVMVLLKDPINGFIDRKTHIRHVNDYMYIRSKPCDPIAVYPLCDNPSNFNKYGLTSIHILKQFLERYQGQPVYIVLPMSNVKQIQFRIVDDPILNRIKYVVLERKDD